MAYMTSKERKKFFRASGNDKYLALQTRPLRVKVYARVSTEHESQINALANQLEWYKSQMYDRGMFLHEPHHKIKTYVSTLHHH